MEIRLVYKIALTFIFLCCLTNVNAAKKKQAYEKKIEKTFDLSKAGSSHISNRYGKLDIKTWDKASISFNILITVNAKSQEAADADFNRINVKFDNSKNHVSAITEIGDAEKKSWWSAVKSSYNSDDFSIDYEVFLPSTIKLHAENKYGHSYIEKMENDLTMTQKYGDFQIAGVDGDFEFSLGYGNGNLGHAKYINGEIKYSKLKIGSCDNIDLESKYSKLTIEEAANIKTISKYDGYTIGTIESFTNEGKYDNIRIECVDKVDVETKYTDVKIEHLNRQGDFDFSYGGVHIEDVDPGFKSLDCDGSYTSFKIDIPTDANFEFDLKGDYSSIDLPTGAKFNREFRDNEDSHFTGNMGNGASNAKIIADLKYGGIRIRKN